MGNAITSATYTPRNTFASPFWTVFEKSGKLGRDDSPFPKAKTELALKKMEITTRNRKLAFRAVRRVWFLSGIGFSFSIKVLK
jgi:hypothetical protein